MAPMLPYLCLCACVMVCDGVCITIHTRMKMLYHQISLSEDVGVLTHANVHVTHTPTLGTTQQWCKEELYGMVAKFA